MLAMVCWMVLHSGTPFCSVPMPEAEAVRVRQSLNADTAGSDVGPPYVVRQGSGLYAMAAGARVEDVAYKWVR